MPADFTGLQNAVITDMTSRILQIQNELITNTSGQANQILDLSMQVKNNYNRYTQLVQSYNAEAQKYAKLYQETKRTQGIGAKLDPGVIAAREAALSKYSELNLTEIKAALLSLHKSILMLQQTLNNLANVNIGMIYVVNMQGTRVAIDISNEDLDALVSLDRSALSKGGGLKLRYNESAILNLIKEIDTVQRQNKILHSKVSEQLNTFFKEIDRRWNIAKQNGGNYILWKVHGQWYKAQITAFGDVEEAYMNVFLNYMNSTELPEFLQKTDIEEQIDSFVHNYISQVDATPGGLVEDIQIGNTGQFFGIKSSGASMAGVMPFVRLAQKICQVMEKSKNRGRFTQSQLKAITKSFSPKEHQAIRTKISPIVGEEFKKVQQEIENGLKFDI